MKKEEKSFKTIEEVRQTFTSKLQEVGVDATAQEPLLQVMMEENRQAWIRGKEYGWNKAWRWRIKKEQAAT